MQRLQAACHQIGEATRLRGEPLGVVWQIHDAQWLTFLGIEGSRKLREARVTASERARGKMACQCPRQVSFATGALQHISSLLSGNLLQKRRDDRVQKRRGDGWRW
jgi:hypothetical protein